MDNEYQIQNTLLYIGEQGEVSINVIIDHERETFWATQKTMAELFNVDRSVITKHLRNIFDVGELDKNSTCAKIAHVQLEGKRTVKRNIPYFNLDMIISVGYRVNSKRGVKFRQWATSALPLPCSFGSLTIITFYIIQTAPSVLQIAPLSP
jgi:hypothetical protein